MGKLKKLAVLGVFFIGKIYAQPWSIDFGNINTLIQCNPAVYSSSGQIQCKTVNPVFTPVGQTVIYCTTDAGSLGGSYCRNWIDLQNPGQVYIGTGSEMQLRGAGGGFTYNFPARFVVSGFPPSQIFAVTFDLALHDYLGSYIFRCGTGEIYKDTVYIRSRDTCSFMNLRFSDYSSNNSPIVQYSNSQNNQFYPNIQTNYAWYSDTKDTILRYQKHTVEVYCNNSLLPITYSYSNLHILNPRCYSVFIDSILQVDNMLDTFYAASKLIDSFMFCADNSNCSNGPFAGNILIIDNIKWTNDFILSPLPIELENWEIKCDEKLGCARLIWSTYSEHDNNGFVIERSLDGFSFTAIDIVAGQGTTNTPHEYEYCDTYSHAGNVYYRLKQVDYDGEETLLGTRFVSCGRVRKSEIEIQGSDIVIETETSGELELRNALGEILLHKSVSKDCRISFETLVPGSYVAIWKMGNSITSKKFVK